MKKTKTEAKPNLRAASKGIAINVYGIKGDKSGSISWPVTADPGKTHPALLAQLSRVYLSNLHQGTVSTKTRGEVVGSTRKIYRQKGTGRARHGDIKAPIFVGGGITFGPKPRSVKRKLPKKMRRQALTHLLYEKAKSGKLFVIADFARASGKTKEMAGLITNLGLRGKPTLVVIEAEYTLAKQGLDNLQTVETVSSKSLSPLSLLKNEALLISQETMKKFTSSSL